MKRHTVVLFSLLVLGVWLGGHTVWSGSLEPSAPPAPTMKTLNEVPPTWSMRLFGASRFQPALNEVGAYLDRETGLVWEASPNSILWNWAPAQGQCLVSCAAARCGWRLPTVEELRSLLDPNQASPFLPNGHPFGERTGTFWTATTNPNDLGQALGVDFSATSFPLANVAISKTSGTARIWCVRGDFGYDGR